MSSSSGDGEWAYPADPRPVHETGYAAPTSPAYGRYGQGVAEPTPPPAPTPPPPVWGQPSTGPAGAPATPVGQFPWSTRLQSVGGLASAVTVLSVLYTVCSWLSALLSPAADRAYEDAVRQGSDTREVLTAMDGVGLVAAPVLLAAWIVTSLWLGRIYDNAVQLRPASMRRSKAWVWLGWFVPIVSYWIPLQILNDGAVVTGAAAGEQKRIPTGAYWGVWVVLNLLSSLSFVMSMNLPPEDSVNPGLEYAIAVLGTLALVLWIRLVARLSAVQNRLAASGPVSP